jgi:hypothetical protein
MSAAGDENATLRAEVLRLKELIASKDVQLACKDEVIASRNEVIASKNAQLSCKDDLVTSKVAVIALLSRTVEELQQYKLSATSSKADYSAGETKHGCEQPSKRQRLHNGSSSFEVASPLDKDEILDHILGFVGGGDHLYIGGVSRRWRGRYMQYCAQNSSSDYDTKFVTRHRSVLMSASRLQLAINNSLKESSWTFDKWSHAELMCKHSLEPQQVMTLLRLHGVPWSTKLCDVAIRYCKLSLLQWLHANSCPWHELDVLMRASRVGCLEVLEWLLAVTPHWSADVRNNMLNRAGWSDSPAAVKWLVAQGAEWPEAFIGSYVYHGTTIHQCWSLSAVQWAITSGSGWLDWHCEDYSEAKFISLYAKKHAADVLNWAHANGCPCTCEQQQQQQQQ